ncbi:hypothetical protein D3C78_1416820 [compost metagenome]
MTNRLGSVKLTIGYWRLSDNLLEYDIKRIDIAVADESGNHADFMSSAAQQLAAFLDAKILHKRGEVLSGMLEEHALQMSAAPP